MLDIFVNKLVFKNRSLNLQLYEYLKRLRAYLDLQPNMNDKQLLLCYTLDEKVLQRDLHMKRQPSTCSKDFFINQERLQYSRVLTSKSNPYNSKMECLYSSQGREDA